jgi:REP-associated tyrosine transposase
MPRTRVKTFIHLICLTKNREPLIDDPVRDELHGFIVEILRALHASPVFVNSVENHVHILYSHSKKHSIGRIAQVLKKCSLKWLESRSPNYWSFQWQGGYAAVVMRKSRLGAAVEYMLRQKMNRRTFEQEYQNFLKRYGVAFEKNNKKGLFRPFRTEDS